MKLSKDASIVVGLVLNTVYTVIAFVFGLLTGSLALIATATDSLLDSFTLGIAFAANRLSQREANDGMSFGYGRATILGALLNATIMLTVAVFIGFEAVKRFGHPQNVSGGTVAVVALIGVALNGVIALILSAHRRDLNMRSVFVDNAVDAVAGAATALSGLIILLTHARWIDSVVGLAIALLLIFNAYKILLEAVQILLEGTPKDLDTAAIMQAIVGIEKVVRVDDMHVWAIRSGYNALSCHIVIDEANLMHSHGIVEAVKAKLKTAYDIQHATVEVELDSDTRHHHHEKH
jgi:cobalt-zinc-cadmium efflux system protein